MVNKDKHKKLLKTYKILTIVFGLLFVGMFLPLFYIKVDKIEYRIVYLTIMIASIIIVVVSNTYYLHHATRLNIIRQLILQKREALHYKKIVFYLKKRDYNSAIDIYNSCSLGGSPQSFLSGLITGMRYNDTSPTIIKKGEDKLNNMEAFYDNILNKPHDV